jgi:benzodiazapine receptor
MEYGSSFSLQRFRMTTANSSADKPLSAGQSAIAFVGSLAVVFAAASVGSQYLPGEWYASLRRPALTPPNWIFGPVWTALYLMMGIAAGLVIRQAGWRRCLPAIGLFLMQLALNAAWSYLFFGLKQPGAALVDIGLLWLAIGATIFAFARWSKLAAALLVPYWLWVSFASYLNFEFWRLNG